MYLGECSLHSDLSFQAVPSKSNSRLPLQSAHNTPDEDENTNLGGLVTYSTFGFRQTLSWAVLESYRSQGWKLATQYGVPTEKLALSTLALQWDP